MPKARTTDSPFYRRMTDRDVDLLYDGMMKHGANFQAIIGDREFLQLADFTPAILQSRYSNLVTKKDARFYRLRESMVSSRSTMSSPRSTPRPKAKQKEQQREQQKERNEQQKPRGTPSNLSRTPSTTNTSTLASQAEYRRDHNDIIEVIDVEAFEGRGGLVGQFNVKLSNMKRAWVPKDKFRPEDIPALKQYIRKLELKLKVAGEEIRRIVKLDLQESAGEDEESSGDDLSLSDGESEEDEEGSGDEDTLMDGVVSDDEDEEDEGSEVSAEEEPSGRRTRRSAKPIAQEYRQNKNESAEEDSDEDSAVESEDDDSSQDDSQAEDSSQESSEDSEVSEAGTVDLEERPAPLQYSDEQLDVIIESDESPSEEEDAEPEEENELPSPEECLEDMFMTQAQTQIMEANAQKSFHGKPKRLETSVKIVEPNPFLASPSLPISIETAQEENVKPAAQSTAAKRNGGSGDDLARKKKRIIENMGAARSNPEADEKCTIM